jgi:hypothetical protein
MASLVLSGDTSGSITVSAPAVAGSTTQTLVNVTGTLAPIVSGTASTTTGGTSVDFSNIPSWVKRITLVMRGVSLSATANFLVQIGTGGTATTSGYTGAFAVITSAPVSSCSAISTGFTLGANSAATSMNCFLTIVNLTGNNWVANGGFAETLGARAGYVTGSVGLAGTLDFIRVTTTSTDTFDVNGGINIIYE